jgi:hypothetical protein
LKPVHPLNVDDVDKLLGIEQSPQEFANAFFADFAKESGR